MRRATFERARGSSDLTMRRALRVRRARRLVGSSCIALGEAIRHHREQTDAFMRQREQNFERQRRLITSELHDTVVRDLTHAVMAAQYAKTAHSDNGVPVHELDAIITQVRRSVGQLRRALVIISESNGDEGLPRRSSLP